MEMVVDEKRDSFNVLIVRIESDDRIKEISGIVSGEHLWLNSVNEYEFLSHVPLDDEDKHLKIEFIQGNLFQALNSIEHPISAIFDSSSSNDQTSKQRFCAILF